MLRRLAFLLALALPVAASAQFAEFPSAPAPTGSASAGSSLLPEGFYLEDAVDASFSLPVAVAFAPGGRMFVLEKRGVVRVVQNGVLLPAPFIDLQSEVLNQADRGLLGIAVDPDFETNRRVYLSYTVDHQETNDRNRLDAYARVTSYAGKANNPNVAAVSSRRVLIGETFATGIPSCYRSHSIGTLAFGSDGSLFVGSGDAASYNRVDPGGQYPECFGSGKLPQSEDIGSFRSQRLESLAGKILRIDPATGRGYASNPFYTGDPDDTASKVWALGLRNPYRFTVDPTSGSTDPAAGDPGRIYIGDVGWTLWEDLNVARGGENFGWPCFEGPAPHPGYQNANPATNGCDTTLAGSLVGPAYTWHHSNASLSVPAGRRGRAIVGGAVYQGTKYPAVWRGALFYGDYSQGWTAAARIDGDGEPTQERLFGDDIGPVVGYTYDPASQYLHLVDVVAGRVRRVRHTGEATNASPVARASATPGQGGEGLRVQLSSDGSFDPDGDALTYFWDFGDGSTSTQRAPVHPYAVAGTYQATLTVSDGVLTDQAATTVTIRSGSPPSIRIVSPTITTRASTGQAVTLRANAADPDQSNGSLFIRWTVTQVHDDHVHPDVFSGSDRETSFVVSEHGVPGEQVYYRVRAEVRDATGLTSSDEVALFLTGDPGEVDVTDEGMLIAAVTAPASGRGSTDIEIVRDSVTPGRNGDASTQYATYTGTGGRTSDWIGLSFDAPRRLSRITFQEGLHQADGGWFETEPQVQVRRGGSWRDVVDLTASPAYRADDGINYDRYELAFAPAEGDAIRVVGRPGGTAGYISVGEIRVWEVEEGGGSTGEIPSPWVSEDVGDPFGMGSAVFVGGTFAVSGSGDIWNDADRFHFVHQPLEGDGSIVSRITSLSPEPEWAKAALMMRATTEAGSPHVAFALSNLGVHVQTRAEADGPSAGPYDDYGRTTPTWLRIDRAGTRFAFSISDDGVDWTEVHTETVGALSGPLVVGLAVSSADFGSGTTSTAFFREVSVTSSVPQWTAADVGSPTAAGSTTVDGSTLTLRGGGDIWTEADRFHFAYQPLAGDGAVEARVTTPTGAQDWRKAGLMIRRSLAPGAAHGFVFLSDLGLHLQYRPTANSPSAGPVDLYGERGPQWLRLERTGQTLAAFRSADRSTWEPVGAVTVPGLGAGSVLAGLAVSAADFGEGLLARGTFTTPSIASAATSPLVMASQTVEPVGFSIDALFPNPARDRAGVRVTLAEDADLTLTVVDVLGRRLFEQTLSAATGVRDIGLDLRAQPPGRYLVRLRNETTGETVTESLTLVR